MDRDVGLQGGPAREVDFEVVVFGIGPPRLRRVARPGGLDIIAYAGKLIGQTAQKLGQR